MPMFFSQVTGTVGRAEMLAAIFFLLAFFSYSSGATAKKTGHYLKHSPSLKSIYVMCVSLMQKVNLNTL